MYEYKLFKKLYKLPKRKKGIVTVEIRNGNTFLLAYNFSINKRYILVFKRKELLIMFVVQFTVS